MDTTVRNHLQRLQDRLEQLNRQMMEQVASQEQRNRLESEMRAIGLAIDHYRAALELEQSVGLLKLD